MARVTQNASLLAQLEDNTCFVRIDVFYILLEQSDLTKPLCTLFCPITLVQNAINPSTLEQQVDVNTHA
jgi:hypothetical protein